MNRLTRLTIPALVAVSFCSALAWADPPTTDTAKWTDRQVLDDLQEKIRESRLKLDVLIGQIQMLDGKLKDLGGLSDKIDQVDRKVDKKVKDLEVMLNQALADQRIVLEQLQKQQLAIDDLRRIIVNGPPPPGGPVGVEAFKPPTKPLDPELEQRFQRIEDALGQIRPLIVECRRATPMRLATQIGRQPGTTRLVRVVNNAPFPVTVYFNDLPYRVDGQSVGEYEPPQDTFTYEVPSSGEAKKTLTVRVGQSQKLTFAWP
jgi:hypothetical protein